MPEPFLKLTIRDGASTLVIIRETPDAPKIQVRTNRGSIQCKVEDLLAVLTMLEDPAVKDN